MKALLTRAAGDEVSAGRREALCRSLASTLRETGDLLWVGGYLLGPDRTTASSSFGFGNDATVGLATLIQIAGELVDGAVALLDRANIYAAAALIRQLVEIEYLDVPAPTPDLVGKVVDTSPKAGVKAPYGSIVTLYIGV